MPLQLLEDRLASARYAYLTSKTEKEVETFRDLIKYLEHQIRDKKRGEIPEEVLD